MRRVSKKQAVSNRKVTKAKREFIEDFVEQNGYVYCCGCGTSSGLIDCSHLIPISYNKSLESDKRNITLHCRSCHNEYERLTEKIWGFNDIEQILKTVKDLDISYYNRIINKYEK